MPPRGPRVQHRAARACAVDVGAAIDRLRNARERRGTDLFAKAIEFLKAHDQRTPFIRIDPVGIAREQDRLVNMDTQDARLEGQNFSRDRRVLRSDRMDSLYPREMAESGLAAWGRRASKSLWLPRCQNAIDRFAPGGLLIPRGSDICWKPEQR